MSPDPGQPIEDSLLVERCQQGDPDALADLRQRHHGALTNILLSRGASLVETEDVLADVWAKCVAGNEERGSLLEKLNGKCRLQSLLARVATNLWIDRKRPEKFRGEPPIPEDGSRTTFFHRVPATPKEDRERALVELLRESLRAGFASCPAEAMLLLRLVYLHGVTQREIVRMLGWHESKVSRTLSSAMEQIKTETLRQLKEREPWLTFTWEDLMDVCETEQSGFL